ncbi:TrbL/VirB6 plasmid conjugal transfer protein [Actinobacteria bacterium OK074]|nr:TrbL/VirB6 plasmid conjugal transfer protein [Actinobacteria bacterium OK074]
MGFCDFPVASTICDSADAINFVSDPGGAVTAGIGNWIAKSSGELATAAADLAAKAVNTTTAIDLNAGWFRDNYELILPIGLVMIVGTFSLQLVRAAFKRDGQALVQAFTGTMIGILFAFSAIALTTAGVEVVDALSDGLFKAAGTSVSDTVRRMVMVSQIGSLSGLGWMVPSLAAIVAAVGAILYWCVMMFRKVGVLVLVTLAVFAGAGGGWEVARRWRRGWIEATSTLIVSKLLMTIVFLLGASAMGKTQAANGTAALSDVMAGMVVMLLVLVCPYATFKFVHWAAEGSDAEALHRSGGAGLQTAARHTQNASRKAAAMAATGGTGAAASGAGMGSAAAPQGPDSVPGPSTGSTPPTGPSGGVGEENSPPAAENAVPPTTFRYPGTGSGPQDGTGDGGRPLITRPDTGSGTEGGMAQGSAAAGTWAISPGPAPTVPAPQGDRFVQQPTGTGLPGGPDAAGPGPSGI